MLANEKPWNDINGYLREKFGFKTVKLSLDGGFTCPNRDGSIGVSGCAFCPGDGSGGFAGDRNQSIAAQIQSQKKLLSQKWPNAVYIAYFQNFTGTYADAGTLWSRYTSVLTDPSIVGIAIATRPDCLGPEVLEVLSRLSTRTFLWIEMGLQTVHDTTARRFGRGYSTEVFYEACDNLRKHNVPFVVHLINGLPGETAEMMRFSAKAVGAVSPWGIKLHLLHVLKGTALAEQWQNGDYVPMGKADYVNLVCDQLGLIPPETLIHRITGDGPRVSLLAPDWSLNKKSTLNAILREMRSGNRCQGDQLLRSLL